MKITILIIGILLWSNFSFSQVEIDWDKLILESNEKDSIKELRLYLNKYAKFWSIDSTSQNGFRLIFCDGLIKKIPHRIIPFKFIEHYIGKPVEIYKYESSNELLFVYTYIRCRFGNSLKETENFYYLIKFYVDPKSELILDVLNTYRY